MEHQSELPYDDRSPTDGELFSLEYLYQLQGPVYRQLHVERMEQLIMTEQCELSSIAIERTFHKNAVANFTGIQIGMWKPWHEAYGQFMSEQELLEAASESHDRIYRAIGAHILASRHMPIGMMFYPPEDVDKWW